jgi:hypothetical protein
VKVANDERVTSGGVCRATDMDIGSEHFSTNFYVLPLDVSDIVLGIQWLRTLGPILWDFDNLTMCFWRDRRRVWWTGVGSMAPRCNTLLTPRDLMEALWDSFTDIFTELSGLPPPHSSPSEDSTSGSLAILLPATAEGRDRAPVR